MAHLTGYPTDSAIWTLRACGLPVTDGNLAAFLADMAQADEIARHRREIVGWNTGDGSCIYDEYAKVEDLEDDEDAPTLECRECGEPYRPTPWDEGLCSECYRPFEEDTNGSH